MKNPIYKPSGRAAEYAEYACNIYTGCDNGCYYCYAPKILHMTEKQFRKVELRDGIVEAAKKQLTSGGIRDKLIGLCFTCDPYPQSIDSTPTREIIKAIKDSGNHVQILTKNPIDRDFDLLDENDWFGVTVTGYDISSRVHEPYAMETSGRMAKIQEAKEAGIKTWVSLEPVLDVCFCYKIIAMPNVDLFRIGKLNHFLSDIDWKTFGETIERLCKKFNRNYYIKEDLRKKMEGSK